MLSHYDISCKTFTQEAAKKEAEDGAKEVETLRAELEAGIKAADATKVMRCQRCKFCLLKMTKAAVHAGGPQEADWRAAGRQGQSGIQGDTAGGPYCAGRQGGRGEGQERHRAAGSPDGQGNSYCIIFIYSPHAINTLSVLLQEMKRLREQLHAEARAKLEKVCSYPISDEHWLRRWLISGTAAGQEAKKEVAILQADLEAARQQADTQAMKQAETEAALADLKQRCEAAEQEHRKHSQALHDKHLSDMSIAMAAHEAEVKALEAMLRGSSEDAAKKVACRSSVVYDELISSCAKVFLA